MRGLADSSPASAARACAECDVTAGTRSGAGTRDCLLKFGRSDPIPVDSTDFVLYFFITFYIAYFLFTYDVVYPSGSCKTSAATAEVISLKDYPIQTDQQLPLLLRSLRKARAMSQAELAERLGVTQQTVSQMERSAAAVTVQRLTKALSVLGAQLVLRDLRIDTPAPTAGERW